MIRAIEASPTGLIVAEIIKRKETGIETIHRSTSHSRAQSAPFNRSSFVLSFLKIFPPDCFCSILLVLLGPAESSA